MDCQHSQVVAALLALSRPSANVLEEARERATFCTEFFQERAERRKPELKLRALGRSFSVGHFRGHTFGGSDGPARLMWSDALSRALRRVQNLVGTKHENRICFMGVDGRAVANFILDFCEDKGRSVTNLSLQKIVYFCQVWSLMELGRPLVKHQFEAWQFGPVLQYLYREFRSVEDRAIAARARRIDPETGKREVVAYRFDSQTEDLLYRVVDFYSSLRSSDLVAMSHVKGGPWDQVWNHGGPVNPGMKIEDSAIVDFYSKVRAPFSVQ